MPRTNVSLSDIVTVAELIRLYRDGLTAKQIGERCGVGAATVRRYLIAAGVRLRTPGSYRQLKRPDVPPDQLRDLYERQKLSVAKVAARLRVPPDFIKSQLAKHNIRRRSKLEAAAARCQNPPPTAARLRRLYLVERKSQTEIAQLFRRTQPQVSQWLARYSISKKPPRSAAVKLAERPNEQAAAAAEAAAEALPKK